MKICKKELLLLGGIYQILALILSSFDSEIALTTNAILYVLFWVAVLAMSLMLIPSWGFVHKINQMMPRLSVFLASIGWIPYFSVIYSIVTVISDYIVNGSNSLTVFLNNYIPVYNVFLGLIGFSLLYAFYKVFFKKEYLNMSCYNYKQIA